MGGPGVAMASRDQAEIDIAGRHFKDDPHPVFARLRAEAPVCRLRFPGKLPSWMVTRYDDVVALLKDERFLKDWRAALTPEQAARVPWIPKAIRRFERNMLDRDPPDHTRLRAGAEGLHPVAGREPARPGAGDHRRADRLRRGPGPD